jgi:hypothetical protein
MLVPVLLSARGLGDDSIQTLIKKLGSANPKERQAATQALQERSDAATGLREATKSKDPEVAARAANILEYIDRRPVRELNATVREGRVDRFIALLVPWPTGKYEEDAWNATRDFARSLNDLHQKRGGEKIRIPLDYRGVLGAKRITESTRADLRFPFFLRANEVDLDARRRKPGEPPENLFSLGSITVASGAVRVVTSDPHIIFAGGSVELEGGEVNGALIVSSGDVTLKCDLGGSLVIAHGSVTSIGGLEGNRIVSGKTVVHNAGRARNSIITENDSNPLGFIRWSDSPKEKFTPKAK